MRYPWERAMKIIHFFIFWREISQIEKLSIRKSKIWTFKVNFISHHDPCSGHQSTRSPQDLSSTLLLDIQAWSQPLLSPNWPLLSSIWTIENINRTDKPNVSHVSAHPPFRPTRSSSSPLSFWQFGIKSFCKYRSFWQTRMMKRAIRLITSLPVSRKKRWASNRGKPGIRNIQTKNALHLNL